MHSLNPITPLGSDKPRTDAIGPITIIEVTSSALASVAARLGREDACRQTLEELLGEEPPLPSRAGGRKHSAFWTGPDQWMIEAPIETEEDLAAQLAGKLEGDASVTEQTDAWCRFDLSGDGLPSVFERLCPVDTREWSGGEVQRTSIEHLGCFLIAREERKWSVIGPRSSAGSLHHALITSCKSAF